ncbi:MAG: hypothetical protein JNN04_14360 [Cyclobacteriaceae bacterium]|nr:hypothetical protein [Cyclobacteriaceae bacterium]
MKAPGVATNLTIFLLFFGAATLDAMVSGHWLRVAGWLVLALFFLGAGIMARRKRE